MSQDNERPVDCLMLLLANGDNLLLPKSSQIEVLDGRKLNIVVDYHKGIIGKIQWRGRNVPLIAFDSAVSGTVPKYNVDTRTVVVHSLSNDERIPYLAFTAQGDPFVLQLAEDGIQEEVDTEHDFVLSCLTIKEKTVFVPNLPKLAEFAATRL